MEERLWQNVEESLWAVRDQRQYVTQRKRYGQEGVSGGWSSHHTLTRQGTSGGAYLVVLSSSLLVRRGRVRPQAPEATRQGITAYLDCRSPHPHL